VVLGDGHRLDPVGQHRAPGPGNAVTRDEPLGLPVAAEDDAVEVPPRAVGEIRGHIVVEGHVAPQHLDLPRNHGFGAAQVDLELLEQSRWQALLQAACHLLGAAE